MRGAGHWYHLNDGRGRPVVFASKLEKGGQVPGQRTGFRLAGCTANSFLARGRGFFFFRSSKEIFLVSVKLILYTSICELISDSTQCFARLLENLNAELLLLF
jgi:hypothetical protein